MRFLSIAALSALSAILSISVHAHVIESRDDRSCGAGTQPSGRGCQNCAAGSFSSGNNSACQACPANTFSASGASSCTACPNGTTSSAGSSQCTNSCVAGQYWSGSQCSTCPAGFYSAAGATSCSTCPADTYSSAGAGSCTSCPDGQGSSAGSSQCSNKCVDGQIYTDGKCRNCQGGTYPSNNVCVTCPDGTVSNPGSASCNACPDGKIPDGNKQTCSNCPSNTYSNGAECTPCPAGMTSNPGSSSCKPQPSKRAQPLVRANICPAGFLSCPVPFGRGGTECIDSMTNLESCGGCVAPGGGLEPGYTGRDCSAIPNVDRVKCNLGRCEITSCRDGYEPSGDSCVEHSNYDGKNGTLRTRAVHSRFARHHSF